MARIQLFFLLSPLVLWAQTPTGQFTGQVDRLFGVVSAQANNPRQIQLGLHIVF